MFANFQKEILEHSAGEYHRRLGSLDRNLVIQWFNKRSLVPPADYVNFLSEIGPGTFFGGLLIIHPLESVTIKSVESETKRLAEFSSATFVFGYNGTTEGCYCLESGTSAENVFWFYWEERVKQLLSSSFTKWIEGQPKESFRANSYAAYKEITNFEAVQLIMDERAKFKIRLVGFEKQLVKSPDRPKDSLPRFNKITFEVTKEKPAQLAALTVKVFRLGSKVGKDNVEYVTIPVTDVPVGITVKLECYLFDPFNQPFTGMELEFNPFIDLSSKMRIKFKEIKDLL